MNGSTKRRDGGQRYPPNDPLGRVWTPPSLARAVVEQTTLRPLEARFGWGPNRVSILDPSCGDGALLAAAEREYAGQADADTYAIDIDLGARGLELATMHMVGDFLTLWRHWERLPISEVAFDLVLQNPPFGKEVGITTTCHHVLAALGVGARRTVVILPAAAICGAVFHELVWAPRPPTRLLRVTSRPWPDRLREACVMVWDKGNEQPTQLGRLDWSGLTDEDLGG